MRVTFLAATLVLAVSGCEDGVRAGPAEGEVPLAGIGQREVWKFEVMKQDRAFDQALQWDGPAVIQDFYAPEGVLVQPGVGEIQGPEEIQTLHQQGLLTGSSFGLTWSPEWAEVSGSGDLGYTVGYYRVSALDSAETRTNTRGTYVTLWRRQADGVWKVESTIRVPTDEAVVSPGG